jgi:hypothetical protein
MAVRQLLRNRKVFNGFVVIFAIIFLPISISGVLAQDKKSQPVPVTTKNPDISIEELEYRLRPLTKDDLAVEADGWLQVLKKHTGKVSEVQIKVLTAEGDAKTELLESVTKLKEQQTALADHLKAVIVEYKSKGGDIVDMVFGIGYSDDMAKAQEVLEESLANHDAILKDPAPVVKVHELADSSVNFVVRPWVETDNYWDVYWDITRSVKERFDAEGVSIPFPQQDVHMHQVAST